MSRRKRDKRKKNKNVNVVAGKHNAMQINSHFKMQFIRMKCRRVRVNWRNDRVHRMLNEWILWWEALAHMIQSYKMTA